MDTDILYACQENRNCVSHDGESFVEIITLSIDVPYHPSYSQLKGAIEAMYYKINEEIRIPRPCSAYDCTGLPFTTGLDVLARFLSRDIEDLVLAVVLKHHVSIDV